MEELENKVFGIRCPNYDQAEEKLKELIGLMQGMGSFVSAGEKIVLKTNLLSAAKPEKAVTTHPSIVVSVGKMVKAEGATPIVADSPGSGYKYNEKILKRFYRVCELDKALRHGRVCVPNALFEGHSQILHFIHFRGKLDCTVGELPIKFAREMQ